MAFIYKITNTINSKIYIGKTERTVKERWQEHLRHSKTLINIPIYRAFNKYGIENFTIETVEECDSSIVNEREQYWIEYYNTYKNGYNCTLGGEGSLLEIPEEDISIISERYKNGERLDKLAKEFHHEYYTIRNLMAKKGVLVNTNAGPAKLSKKIYAIDPITLKIEKIYDSISAAARDICQEGRNPNAIGNHISKYKNTATVSHGYLWKTEEYIKGE